MLTELTSVILCAGTPIVEMFSPFVKLPSQDGWGKDMSEHVAFENLPNYTGKWEQMSGLIKRIRSVLRATQGAGAIDLRGGGGYG